MLFKLTHDDPDNISFLVKYKGGPSVEASQVTVSIIDVRGPKNSEAGQKATVCLRNGPDKYRIVVSNQVEWGEDVLLGLSEKTDEDVSDILAHW